MSAHESVKMSLAVESIPWNAQTVINLFKISRKSSFIGYFYRSRNDKHSDFQYITIESETPHGLLDFNQQHEIIKESCRSKGKR